MASEVKISFRTCMKDLPEDMKLLLKDVEQRLEGVSRDTHHSSDLLTGGNYERVLYMLGQSRDKLDKANKRLSDCMSILSQYNEYMGMGGSAGIPQDSEVADEGIEEG